MDRDCPRLLQKRLPLISQYKIRQRSLVDVREEISGRSSDDQVSMEYERNSKCLQNNENYVPLFMRQKDPFIPVSEAYLSIDSIDDSLVKCDVSNPQWRVIRHVFCLLLPLAGRRSSKCSRRSWLSSDERMGLSDWSHFCQGMIFRRSG